jgi:predicted phosphate transport protein (TIGR00153 family)
MLKHLIPREEKFFDHFRSLADLIVQGAREFRELAGDLDHLESRARNLKFLETAADEVTHNTVELLHKTFITPLDRGDIYRLVTKMDDILDMIEAAAQRMYLYEMREAPSFLAELADICVKATEHIREAVANLERLKDPEKVLKHCVEVHRLENEADHIFRTALGNLFREEQDTRQLIKKKEIVERLETVTDCCESVANIIEGIVLEYA